MIILTKTPKKESMKRDQMKTLGYFEKRADELRAQEIDYRLITRPELILALMKQYRKDHATPWMEYKKTYDKWFIKYH